MKKMGSLFAWLSRHKYGTTILVFALLIGVVDNNSLYRRMQNRVQLAALKSEIQSYQDKYDCDTRRLNELQSSTEAVRRVAREKYFMKREGEDIFVFVSDSVRHASAN